MAKTNPKQYDILVEKLKSRYLDSDESLRLRMLADLERTIEKYSRNDLTVSKLDAIRLNHSFEVRPDIADFLRYLRANSGLTLEQLSDETGLACSTLGYHEAINNSKVPSPRSIETYARFYRLDSDQFYLPKEET